jgi:hypothetical protein
LLNYFSDKLKHFAPRRVYQCPVSSALNSVSPMKAESYRIQARKCRDLAATAPTVKHRDKWLAMAANWHCLAEETDYREWHYERAVRPPPFVLDLAD